MSDYSVKLYVNGHPLENLTIDDTVTDIPEGAYQGLKFKTVTIGANVKTMGANCFTAGNILKTIWLPNVVPSGNPECAKGKVNYCSSSAYKETLFASYSLNLWTYPTLTSRFTVDGIVYALDGKTADVIDCDYEATPTSVNIGPNVTYMNRTFPVRNINNYACYDFDNLNGNLLIANNGYVGSYAFYDCDSIKNLTAENQSYINYQAFANSTIATSATIQNQGFIGEGAFENVTGEYVANINNTGAIGVRAFAGDSISTLSIGSNVTDIKTNAFRGSNISENATIRNNGNIEENAFQSISGGFAADINNNGSIGDYAFASSEMSTMAIRNSVSDVGIGAFQDADIFKSASINHTGTTGRAAFSKISHWRSRPGKGYTRYYFDADIQCSGILPDSCFYNSSMDTVTIGNDITSLEKNCFESSYFKTATIGSSVASIKERGFARAAGFKSMTLPDNVTTMDEQAFKECSSMKEISLSRGLSLVKEGSFSGCTALEGIFLPQQIDSIGNNVFDECSALRTVTFEDKVGDYRLGYSTAKRKPLFGTAGLDSVYVGGRLKYDTREEACYSPFRGHSSLRALRFNDNEVRIYDCEFENCTALQNIYMGAGIDSICQYAFSGCTALERVKVGMGVRPLCQYSFAGCTSLKDIDLSNVVTINNNSFERCTALQMIRLPHTTTSVADQTFLQCTALKDLIIEDRTDTLQMGFNDNNTSYKGITGAGTPLFSDCPLDSVYIGGPIKYSQTKKDGYSPFYYNESLRTVFVNSNEKQVYQNEFFNCLNMTTIRLGEGVESIEPYGFQSCTGLLYFTFGSTLQSIGANGFSDCSNVAVITSHATTPPVCGEQALADINFWTCKLYVPAEAIESYQNADQWEMFWAEPLDEPDEPDEPEPSIPGDVNGDDDVNGADIVAVINYVLNGSETDGDVNGDGEVNGADIVAVINYVLNHNSNTVKRSIVRASRDVAMQYDKNNRIYAEAGANDISLALTNATEFTAFQFVVQLSEGQELADIMPDRSRLWDHTIQFRPLTDGRYFVLGYSADNECIDGDDGILLNLMLCGGGCDSAVISDVCFFTPQAKTHRLEGLQIDITTGMASLTSNTNDAARTVYDTQGRRVANSARQKGIYVQNGRKIVVK